MPNVDVTNIELGVIRKVNENSTPASLLAYARALEAIRTGFVYVVNSTVDLPSASACEGRLYFVENIQTLYWSNSTYGWLAIDVDRNARSVYSWGCLCDGISGGNVSLCVTSSPVSVINDTRNWQTVCIGNANTFAIKTDNTLWYWGRTGFTVNCSPVQYGGLTNWCAISNTDCTTGAITTDGCMWSCGCSSCGGLGNNSITSQANFVDISWGSCWIATSRQRCLGGAIKSDGSLWTWGHGQLGGLGNNCTTNRSSPGTTAGEDCLWCNISMGTRRGAGIKTNGTLWTWGSNYNGSLGNLDVFARSSPGTIAGGGTDWCFVAINKNFSINNASAAIKTDGTLWTWGANHCGMLGNNDTTIDRSSPGTVAGGGTDWCRVSMHNGSVFAVKTNGTGWSWGRNNTGQLGNGTTIDRSSPGTVVGNSGRWVEINSAGAGDEQQFAAGIAAFSL